MEAEVRAAENKFNRARAEHTSTQEEWVGRLRELDKKRNELKAELDTVDKTMERLRKMGVPILPEMVDKEKAEIQDKIDEVQEKRLDVAAQADTELSPLAEKTNEALKTLSKAKAELDAVSRYETTLVK